MLLPNIMNDVLEVAQVDEILQTNQESEKYGLTLTPITQCTAWTIL